MQLIIKFLHGKTTVSEEAELQAWINESPENAAHFSSFRTVWLSTAGNMNDPAYNKEQAWDHISKGMETGTEEQETSIGRHVTRFSIRQILRIAAFIIFIFLCGGICSLIIFRNSVPVSDKSCLITTPLGSITHLVLPDNSQVWLNAGSTLTYLQSFDRKKREVKLQGEAYFKVKSDKSKPFIVNTGQYAIKALGTSFNVKAYPEDNYISTTLVEGTIHVNGLGIRRGFSYILKPNQNLTIPLAKKNHQASSENRNEPISRQNPNIIIKPTVSLSSTVKTEAMVSWKDQRWTIQGEPLGTLAVLLGRRYNTTIHLSSALLDEYRFTGIIQNETLEQVLQYLRYTAPLKYKIGKGEVWWDIDPDLAGKYSKILNKK